MTLARPLILVIDDLLGRSHADGPNEERANICAQLSLRDVSDDGATLDQTVRRPIADAIFIRGQKPQRAGIGDVVANDIDGVVDFVRSGWRQGANARWSLVLLDLSFLTGRVTAESDAAARGVPAPRDRDLDPASYFGLEILARLTADFPQLPVVIMSTRDRARVALSLATRGALGFIETDALDGATALSDALYKHALVSDERGRLIGASVALMDTMRVARRASLHNQNVLIVGESGVGKELLAEYLNSIRPAKTKRPFCVVNSATLAADTYGRELFGYRKGAFAEAQFERSGMIEMANRGDLFLDEVSTLPPEIQAGLLRVVEEGRVTPLGGGLADQRKVNVRFVCSTSADLDALARTGGFRADLLERLRQGAVIVVPPLRDRKDDIPLLLERFVRQAEEEMEARPRELTDGAIAQCLELDWPGNVRQLRNVAYAAVAAYPDVDFLLPAHLGNIVGERQPRRRTPASGDLAGLVFALEEFDVDALDETELRGSLPVLESAMGRLLLQLLRAGLARHSRPGGRVFIQPALQFLMDDEALSATSAYDLVKRIARRAGLDATSTDVDELVQQALARSVRGRQKKVDE